MHIFGPSRAAVIPIKIIKAATAVNWQTADLVPADRYMTLNLAIKTLTLSSSHRIIALLSFAFVRSRSGKRIRWPVSRSESKMRHVTTPRWRVATMRFTLRIITRTIAKCTNTAYLTRHERTQLCILLSFIMRFLSRFASGNLVYSTLYSALCLSWITIDTGEAVSQKCLVADLNLT